MSQETLTITASNIGSILTIFVAAFLVISLLALFLSVFRGKDAELAKSCRLTSSLGLFIGIILLYLRFVLV